MGAEAARRSVKQSAGMPRPSQEVQCRFTVVLVSPSSLHGEMKRPQVA